MNELYFHPASLLNALCFGQGLILGIYLIAINYKKSKATFFLGWHITIFSLILLPYVLFDSNLTEVYDWMYFFPCNFLWLEHVFLFLYVREISICAPRLPKPRLLLLPGLIYFVVQVVVYFLPYKIGVAFYGSALVAAIQQLSFVYTFLIDFYILFEVYRHQKEIQNQYSNLKNKELAWVSYFIVFSIATKVLTILYLYIENCRGKPMSEVPVLFILLNVVTIYWLIFQGIKQKEVVNLTNALLYYPHDTNILAINDKEKGIAEETMIDKSLEQIVKEVINVLNETKIYRQKDLTIVDVAIKVDVHPKKLSQAINLVTQQNFNAFINSYRIEEAKLLLKTNQMLSIDGIADEVGFKSKSVFYSSFKQLLGTTPKNYQNEVANL